MNCSARGMEISDLATSAGINIGLATLFLLLYSVFRKNPRNAGVYSTRQMLREKRKEVKREPFSLNNLLPSPGWLVRAWNPSEDEILETAGLDAVVFLRIFKFCIRFFTICTLVGCGILAPLNFNDTYIADHPSGKEEENGTLEKLTILNISQGSPRLWFHLAVLYFISFTAYILLYSEYREISMMRQAYLMEASPQPDQFSVLVRGIPKPDPDQGEKSYSERVEKFFIEFHPLHYLSHQMIFHSNELESLLKKFDYEKNKLANLKSKPLDERKPCRTGFLGLFGPTKDRIEYHTQKLEELFGQIREQQINISCQELPAAFVSFRTRWEAVVAAQTQQSVNPMYWVTEWAPEPRDVDWNSLKIGHGQLFIRRIFSVAVATLIILFTSPVIGVIQLLDSIDRLTKYLPDPIAKILFEIPGVKQVVQGYLPSLLTVAVLYGLPLVMMCLAKIAGYVSISRQERKTAGMVFNLLWINVFVVSILGTSIFQILDTYSSDPRSIPRRLAEVIPGKAYFFMTYIMTTGWAGFPLEILQSSVLILNYVKRIMVDRSRPLLSDVWSLPYYRCVPNVLLFVFLGLTYSIITPLLLPFLLVYFVLGYIVFRNQILHVYEPAYETGGQFWPHVHVRIIIFLVFLQICFIGVFTVKGLGNGSFFVVPLPIFTLMFNEYCRQRFFPAFRHFNMESTVKKDQADARKGLREDLLEHIRVAYLHPALRPVDMESAENPNTESLLPSTSKAV
ncbi:CSC1-like protein HYP1 [Physcomitrium patens]|uniref:CSC1-like protein HYP1 n=1 Tax=Physcomitrium patens TaxID=3218 RepID=UPI003CCD7669